ncbi:MAG: hypothetical protein HY964_08150 [Ignavibacteriales bacterium]|nr:hypothetical protein [Ignavibacteriales bacterium]
MTKILFTHSDYLRPFILGRSSTSKIELLFLWWSAVELLPSLKTPWLGGGSTSDLLYRDRNC